MTTPDPTFFETPADFRQWLEAHYQEATELWVGFYKTGSGKPGITWSQSVDQALCFGWIDGIRKSIDDVSYQIRFTPRKPGSIWSVVNLKKVEELSQQGLMQQAGLEVYAKRNEKKSNQYSFEQESIALPDAYEALFRRHEQAWAFFQSRAPSYRKAAIWWVINARQAITQQKRLTTLITDSEAGRRVAHLTRRNSAG
jgi:uncharacterized protein YdeI (YjbR/CyaY-like superfamily)